MSLIKSLGCFSSAVMKRTEPPIPGNHAGTVIAFKISMMQLVMKDAGINAGFSFDNQIGISCMGCYSSHGGKVEIKKQMYWMGSDHQMHQHHAEEYDLFNWVH